MYFGGSSPIKTIKNYIDDPAYVVSTYELYLWYSNDINEVQMIDVIEPGELAIIIGYSEDVFKHEDGEAVDCLIMSPRGKLGWSLIDSQYVNIL